MVSLENLLLYIPLAALLVMLPGPDFALIVRTSLTEGRSSGQAAACGVALGIMVHTSAAMLGISAVIAQSVTLFTLLRYAGAAYLFWMGIHALRAGREVTAAVVRHGGQEEEVQPVRGLRRRAFRQGFLTNALNPKAVVFFLTMLPQFLDPHAALWPQFLELGGIMAFFCLGWFVLLASLLHRIRRLFARPSFQAWLHRLTGLIFICFARWRRSRRRPHARRHTGRKDGQPSLADARNALRYDGHGSTAAIRQSLPRSRTIPVLMRPFVTIALAAIAGGVLRPLSSAGPGGWSTDEKSVPDAGGSGNIL